MDVILINDMLNGNWIRKSGKSYPEIVTKQLDDVKSRQLKVNNYYRIVGNYHDMFPASL